MEYNPTEFAKKVIEGKYVAVLVNDIFCFFFAKSILFEWKFIYFNFVAWPHHPFNHCKIFS